ncbi:MAG TPA: rod shape-determining protein MreC [Gemmatimonadales bacterium]|jgi:rod shape-determining protein MreC|nr:rod shape-determining protein MreC [Gemmatimonadales bacterium]
MLSASDRSYSRRDSVALAACVAVAIIFLMLSESAGQAVSGALRQSILSPLVWLQSQAELGRTSRSRLRAVAAERDSAALIAQTVPVLRAENARLRDLLSLSHRMQTDFTAAEVLHQSTASDERMLLINAGALQGISAFEPVVAPEGLIGVVAGVTASTATVMTWAHPDFRVSAYAAGGRVVGMVAPSSTGSASEASLEFRAASYRDTLPSGTLILSSGLGGVYPKGIPVGTVTGVAREQAGWERIYSLRPAANPSAEAHLMVLTARTDSTIAAAFPSDSILAAVTADSMKAARVQDSMLRARIADSVRAWLRDSTSAASRVPHLAPSTDSVPPQ